MFAQKAQPFNAKKPGRAKRAGKIPKNGPAPVKLFDIFGLRFFLYKIL